MKKKEKGSALILAILILTFFMALTMNMYYMAQKKSERAGKRSKGIKSLGEISFGSALGMYEYRLAQWFEQGVIEGAIGTNTETADKLYDVTENGGTATNAAIRITNYSDYFTSEITTSSPNITTDATVDRLYKDTATILTPGAIAKHTLGGYNPIAKNGNEITYLKKIKIKGTEASNGKSKDKIQAMIYEIKYKESVTTGAGTIINAANAMEITAELN